MSNNNPQKSRYNEGEFEVIFKHYYQKVKEFVEKFVCDRVDSDEIVQAVFIRVWKNMDKIAGVHDINRYLFVVTRNALRDYFRAQSRHKARIERLTDNHNQVSGNSFDEAFESLSMQELKTLVDSTVSKMPDRRRKVYTLSREEGKTPDTIAKEMGISKRTVEKQIQIALSMIRRSLKNRFN